jgi:pimeloyl-ACP methyl ester carboxylesterase
MTNSRGNKYSRNNTKLSPDQFLGKFWDFSYEQMAQFDVPAVLQYVTAVTGQPKVVFIGHSQGTTQMFAALASNEAEVRSRVALFVALAPVSSLKNCQSLFLRALADLGLDKIVALLGIKEFLPSSALLQLLLPTLCESTPLLCETVIYLFTGLNPPNLNTSRFDVYMDHFPSGTSVRAMEHFSQSIRHGSFSRYDFGVVENLIVYGSISPPAWNVSAIDTPTALFYGSQDPLGDVKDVTDLISQMTASTLVRVGGISSVASCLGQWLTRDILFTLSIDSNRCTPNLFLTTHIWTLYGASTSTSKFIPPLCSWLTSFRIQLSD